MFLKLNESALINLKHVIKIEKANSSQEGFYINFYNTIHPDIKFTRISFQGDGKARDDFYDKVLSAISDQILSL